MGKRIPELDVLRGAAVVGMVIVHFFYDLQAFGGIQLRLPIWLEKTGKYGHLIFILLSGTCATLGHSSFQRGVQVFGWGLLVSYVTLFMEFVLGYDHLGIWFGILHLLGVSMMLYPLFRDFISWELVFLGLFMILGGTIFSRLSVEKNWLFPFGLCSENQFPGSDFFPVLPYFGWFLMGASAGKTLYSEKRSLFPRISRKNLFLVFLQKIGKNSLPIYLLHQPVLFIIVQLIT